MRIVLLAAISQCGYYNIAVIAAVHVMLSNEMSWLKKVTGWRLYRHEIF